MNLQKTSITFFVLCFFVFTGFTQEQALSKIDKNDLKKHLTFISSDELQGRKIGTAVDGLGITADYIAKNIKRIGLKPGAKDYFQSVDLVTLNPDSSNLISITNGKDKVYFETSDIVNIRGETGMVQIENGTFVLAGFGTEDLSAQQVENKIVVVGIGNAELYKEGTEFRWNNRVEREKIKTISALNPKAIVFVGNPKDTQNKTFSQIQSWYSSERIQLKANEMNGNNTPVFLVLPGFVNQLLKGKDKYKKYLEAVADGNRQTVIPIENKSITINSQIVENPIEAKNIIGVVEGTDPELKNECVVFMAHYDHLGIGKDGDVFNGADDNGSGTVAIMELAEAFASLDVKPKRSIVFLWVTCEELGMFGSNYYSEHPIFPMDKTVCCVNLDMVGRVFEARDTVWNRSPKKVKDFNGLFTLTNDVWPEIKEINSRNCKELGLVPDYTLPANFLRSSDHYHFHRKGVPILNYATGYHADYHKVGDEVSKINFDKIKRVTDLCFLVGLEIANLPTIDFERETGK